MEHPIDGGWNTWLDKYFKWLLLFGVAVNLAGLLLPVMEPDGALYAVLSKNMVLNHDFINLKLEGKDWLDKPHFPFWITAFSFECFGINAFAYKLPGLLFWLAGAWFTFRFATEAFGRDIARVAVLIYLTAEHLVLSNNDVRAEPYLTGLIIGSVYFLYRLQREYRLTWLLAAAILAACAVMTKGIFVIIIIGGGPVIAWMFKGDWKQFLQLRWWSFLVLTLLFTAPELYSLYLQFDLHPEKTVFGQHHVSGIRFFFWDSQFGRFFNSGPIKGKGDPFFYLHTLLWAFLPWSLLLYAAIFSALRKWKQLGNAQWICIGCSVIPFLMFSASKFQLPHYLNIVFPFFAVITAWWLVRLQQTRALRTISIVQNGIVILLAILVCTVILICRFRSYPVVLVQVTAAMVFGLTVFRNRTLPDAFGRSFAMALIVNGFLFFIFYPDLFRYQSGQHAAAWLNEVHPGRPAGMLEEGAPSFSFELYLRAPYREYSFESLRLEKQRPVMIYAPPEIRDSLASKGFRFREEAGVPHFHITELNGKFLNAATRTRALERYSLLEVQ